VLPIRLIRASVLLSVYRDRSFVSINASIASATSRQPVCVQVGHQMNLTPLGLFNVVLKWNINWYWCFNKDRH